MSTQDQQFITEMRAAARFIVNGLTFARNGRATWNARGYGSALEDGINDNEGISGGEVGSAIFATCEAIDSALSDPALMANLLKII